ncbi:MAG: ATP-binding protein [Patescibacteria group bacterium]
MEIIKYNKENTPNAAKLMGSLRYSGYDNNIAISDLIDNSLDANATNVKVEINLDHKKESYIVRKLIHVNRWKM